MHQFFTILNPHPLQIRGFSTTFPSTSLASSRQHVTTSSFEHDTKWNVQTKHLITLTNLHKHRRHGWLKDVLNLLLTVSHEFFWFVHALIVSLTLLLSIQKSWIYDARSSKLFLPPSSLCSSASFRWNSMIKSCYFLSAFVFRIVSL